MVILLLGNISQQPFAMAALLLLFCTLIWIADIQNPCKDFNQYFWDIVLARGTRRVVNMLFGNFLVRNVPMATLFLYFFHLLFCGYFTFKICAQILTKLSGYFHHKGNWALLTLQL